MRHCTKCGQPGHNARTCGQPRSTTDNDKQGRRCSVCGEYGHNKATCKQFGREVLAEQTQKVDRIEVNGIVPQKGLWILSEIKKKIAGKIVQVKRDGRIVWKGINGICVTQQQEEIINNNYIYSELEPEMLLWNVVGNIK